MASSKRSKLGFYLAYFDTLGFESIIDLWPYEKDFTWSVLKGTAPTMKLPVGHMLMRARANPQRSPEIWTFQSEVGTDELYSYAQMNPQGLADLIREHGTKVYVTPKQEQVIR